VCNEMRSSGGNGSSRSSHSNRGADLHRAAGQHICIVTETYPPEVNGVALTLEHLVKGLIAQGYSVSVVRPHQAAADSGRSLYDCEVTLVGGMPLPGYDGLQFGLPAGRVLRRAWRKSPPDVVYVATEGPLGWSAVRLARCLGIPIVSGFHTNYHTYSLHYHLGLIENLVFRYLRRFHNRTACTLVANSDLRERLCTWGFNNVNVLDRGVDNKVFSPDHRSRELRREWGVSDDEVAVLYVGRLAPEKNINLAISTYRAMKRLRASVKFVLVGDGPSRAALQNENPDLVFAGMRKGEQLARHYASADLFLFPSETETFGNVTLEAMASGLGVVAYDYAAAKVHIKDGETGMSVPYGDQERFIESAVRLARESQFLAIVRRRAREHIKAYDWPRVVERFENLLWSAQVRNSSSSNSPLAREGLAL